MEIELVELRPVPGSSGLLFMAAVALGGITIRGWRGMLWNNEVKVGVPVRTYWQDGERFHEPLVDAPEEILKRISNVVLKAWGNRATGDNGNASLTTQAIR